MAFIRNGTKLAYCTPGLWLENMGHIKSHGRASAYELILSSMGNGLLFGVPLGHWIIYACYHRIEW